MAPRGVLGALARWRASRELRRLLPHLAPGDLVVEVGAGAGLRSAALAALGARVLALEPDATEAARARGAIPAGVHVRTGDLGDLATLSHADAVMCWHVLEHMDDPGAALRRMRALLRPGGTLLLAVPNARSAEARLLRGRWHGWEPARHRRHFTARTLRRELHDAGFAESGVRVRGGWFPALGLACSVWPGVDPQVGGAPTAALTASLAVTPLAALGVAAGMGPQLVARAQRTG